MNHNERKYCLNLRDATRSTLKQAETYYLQSLKEIGKLYPATRQEHEQEALDIIDTGRCEENLLNTTESNVSQAATNVKKFSVGVQKSNSGGIDSNSKSDLSFPVVTPIKTKAQVHKSPNRVNSKAVGENRECSSFLIDFDEIVEFVEMGKRKPRRILLVSDKIYHNLSDEVRTETGDNAFCSNRFHCTGGCYCSKISKVKPLLNHCIHCQSFNPLLKKKSDFKLSTVATRCSRRRIEDGGAVRNETEKRIMFRASIPDADKTPKHRVFTNRETKHFCSPAASTTNVHYPSSNSEEPTSTHSPNSNSTSSLIDNPEFDSHLDKLARSTSTLKIHDSKKSTISEVRNRSCQTSPIHIGTSSDKLINHVYKSHDGGGDGKSISLTSADELHRVRDFRDKNLFECHSSTSLLERDKAVMMNVVHACEHDFYLNDRLFLTPCNPDHKNESRCKICSLPARNKKSANKISNKSKIGDETDGVWINVDPLRVIESDDEVGIITSKVLIEPDGIPAEMRVKFPMKDSVFIKERKSAPTKIQKRTTDTGVLKVNSRFLRKIEPPSDSLALKYQKGYRDLRKGK